MVIALLTTDNRENFREYTKTVPWFGSAPDALMQGFSMLPDVTVHVVSCTQRPLVSPAQIRPNIHFHSLTVPKIGWLRTGYQGCIRAVRRKLKTLKPDIVHGQGTERDCAISAVWSGYPNVVTVHGNMRAIARVNRARPFTYLWLAAKLEKSTLPRTDGVVCITRYTEDAVKGLAPRTWILPNAVDESFFRVTNHPAAMPKLLCVGNIQERKNQNALIRALDPLAVENRFQLIFLGPVSEQDPYSREFQSLVKQRDWCLHAGAVGRVELQKHLTDAAALVLPSLEDNCPMVVLEAMASGVPVFASRVGGVPELIEHGVTGYLFESRSDESMRDAVRHLLRSTEHAKALAEKARESAVHRFHPREIASRHLEIYREVVSIRS